MENALYVTINGSGIMLILLMLFNFGTRKIISGSIDDKMFTVMLHFNMAILISDALMWTLDGASSPAAGVLLRIITMIYYILQPAICLVWYLYCEYKLHGDTRKIVRQLPWLVLPAAVTVVMTIVSMFKPLLFYFDSQNHYHRAEFFHLGFILSLLYIFLIYLRMLRIVAKDPKTPKKQTIQVLYLYPIFPVVCAVIQWLFYGLSIIWIGSAISLLIIYFNLQNTLITTDVLTGLNNRRRFETYIENKLNAPIRQPLIFALMIDIDRFRNINNKYGHSVGDQALKNVANIIKTAVHRNDFIARFGGEEFVVIGERDNTQSAFETMKAIKDETARFNEKKSAPYVLSMSIGYAFLKAGERRTADEIIKEADKRMYNEKERIDGEI